MSRINVRRVILGGLLVGMIINISEMILHMAALGNSWKDINGQAMSSSTIAVMIFALFLLGVASVWTYAVMRPRFGPGVKTAVITGLTVWIFASLFPSIQALAMGYLPKDLVLTALIWRLFEFPIAIHAGAGPYREK